MVRASVRAIIHSLTLVDYLPIQTHKPYSIAYHIGICAVSPKPSLFAHMTYGSRRRADQKQTSSPMGWLRMRVWRVEFTEDEKYHNLMSWLTWAFIAVAPLENYVRKSSSAFIGRPVFFSEIFRLHPTCLNRIDWMCGIILKCRKPRGF